MNDRITVPEVVYNIQAYLKGQSPLVAVLGWNETSILLGRDGQRWEMLIRELPTEGTPMEATDVRYT